ncbi:LacI family transcriptional regulator [Polymorphobacter arshaanensis]|uniref:LacI family transcriptional regulator n=1 Tax=Glacieibacterium arshaanense TaxID=2511025 RepID=A0A4Y9EQQ6_9SPHN|nr:LacI family DNA-binding transcriptional regulator [Polymorphobacter arshaanensis]TFU05924.1 LacI family transcriptional regulator [Polymorphobacter arshaanensis]
MDKTTSFDIAQAAGVSQPTVSRALRGSPLVNEATRRRIEAIARQLNYTVDKNASSLRTSRSRTLALLFFEDPTPDESNINPFFLSMVGAITRACAAHGYDLLISFQQLSSNWHVDFEDSRKADGILLLGYGDYHLSRARLEALDAQGTHFVRWGSVRDGQPGITIGCDNVAGGRDVTAHLLALGRRRIAFIGAATDHYPEFEDRFTGYGAAHAAAGLVADPALQVDAIATEAAGFDATTALLARGVAFDAVFAASDLIAIGALRALHAAGLRTPHDVAVAGFDDLPAAAMANPPLTTVAQDVARGGAALVGALLDRIENRDVGDRLLPARLVVRKSCGAAA